MQEEVETQVVSLVRTRLRLAKLVGYRSYADYRLARDSLAQSQEAVLAYLRRRRQAVITAACDEKIELEDFARKLGLYAEGQGMNACDRAMLQHACLTHKLKAQGLDDVSTLVRTQQLFAADLQHLYTWLSRLT